MLLLLVVIVDEIKEHQTSFEFDGWFTLAVVDVAILFFLFLGGKEEFQATMLVELDKTWLVVGIDNEETATRLRCSYCLLLQTFVILAGVLFYTAYHLECLGIVL